MRVGILCFLNGLRRLAFACSGVTVALAQSGADWRVTQVGRELRIAHGTAIDAPQYAALHLDSSYFRMTPATTTGWGTSVILMPALRTRGQYLQGAAVQAAWKTQGPNLVLTLTGSISTLAVDLRVTLEPPHDGLFVAQVSATTRGAVQLDAAPGEAFKPVMLSSMRESETIWDARDAYADEAAYALPLSGWVLPSPHLSRRFGLRGGDSSWKPGAPAVEVTLLEPAALAVTGWVTASTDPNDDNVGLWANADTVLATWSYQLVAKSAAQQALTPPAFSPQPVSQSVAGDGEALFACAARGTPTPALQWETSGDAGHTWTPLAEGSRYRGTRTTELSVATAGLADLTRFRCVAQNSAGTAVSDNAVLLRTNPGARLINLAARAHCGTGDDVAIAGVVVRGTGAKRVLVRAVGPTLARHGIAAADVLADPQLTVHRGDTTIASNNDWSEHGAAVKAAAERLGASALASDDTTSAALLLDLAPGAYTFVVSGRGATTGIVLLEVYDAAPDVRDTAIVNLAARAHSGAGDRVAIGGLVVGGSGAKHVLLRAVGPTLTRFGLEAGDVLQDPRVSVHRGGAMIATSEDWDDRGESTALAQLGGRVGATPLALSDARSAAVLLALAPGPCTFIAESANGSDGVVLVEMYDVD